MKKVILSIFLVVSIILTYTVIPASAQADVISDMLAVGGNECVTVSWNSGDMSDIARVELYEGTTRLASSAANPKAGVTVVGTDDNKIPRNSDIQNIVCISGLANGSEYSYKLVTTSNDGERIEYFTEPVKPYSGTDITDGWASEQGGYSLSKAYVTDEDAIVGDFSLKIISNANAENYQKITPEVTSEPVTGEKYKFEFYAKSVSDTTITVSDTESVSKEITGEWEKYTHIFEYIGEVPAFVIDSEASGIYLDWVTLRPIDSDGNPIGENLIENSNFETTEVGGETTVPEALNFMAAGRDRSLIVSWRNPKADNIKKITVYNESGEAIASSEDGKLSTASEASNTLTVGSLTNGKKYKYSLRIDYSGGMSYRTEAISNTLGDAGQMLWGTPKGVQSPTGWLESVSGAPYTKFEVTSKEKYEGNSSLLVRNNLDGAISNTYQNFGPDITVETGKNYRFSFYAKAVNTDMFFIIYSEDGKQERRSVNIGTADWKQYSFDFSSYARFMFERRADALYIDNCEFYEIDTDGNQISDNLITNGGFEEGYNEVVPAEVEDVSGELGMGSAYLAWKSEPADASYIHVYTKNGDSEYLRAIVNHGAKAVMLNGGIASDFVIKTVNSSGLESDGVTVSCTPADVEISQPVITLDGQEVETLTPGAINVSRKVKNNNMGDEYSGVLIVALYEGNIMKQYKTQHKLLPELGVSASPVDFSIDIAIDEVTENTALKVFMWDSMEKRNSISDMSIYK